MKWPSLRPGHSMRLCLARFPPCMKSDLIILWPPKLMLLRPLARFLFRNLVPFDWLDGLASGGDADC